MEDKYLGRQLVAVFLDVLYVYAGMLFGRACDTTVMHLLDAFAEHLLLLRCQCIISRDKGHKRVRAPKIRPG